MGVTYTAIGWNRQKRLYDRYMLIGMVLYLIIFSGAYLALFPEGTPETLIIRATGSLALVMLHLILSIGPLARLEPRFLPLLYNRRHFGVIMFLVAAIHGIFSIIQFHTLGDINPILSIFQSNTHYDSLSQFPFQPLGFLALLILFFMAATSHDFWLNRLGPKAWKTLHMLVYVAYALLVMHVLLGVAQWETHPALVGSLALGVVTVVALHISAGMRQVRKDTPITSSPSEQGFVKVCAVDEIEESRAKMVIIKDQNIAIFKYGDKLSAVHNLCKHQNGPLGEGKIINGCIVCPWHGYEYRPEDGCSPPPFTEKVATFKLMVQAGVVWVNPDPLPEGTPINPAIIS